MRQKWISSLLHAATLGGALMCGAIALLVIGFLVRQGCPEFWACVLPGGAADGRSEQADYLHMAWLPALWNTLFMIVAVLLPAIPIGTGAAIFLTEYASRGSRFAKAVSLAVETLAAFWFFAVRPAAGLGVFLSCRCVHAAADGAAADHSHCAGGAADDSCGPARGELRFRGGKGQDGFACPFACGVSRHAGRYSAGCRQDHRGICRAAVYGRDRRGEGGQCVFLSSDIGGSFVCDDGRGAIPGGCLSDGAGFAAADCGTESVRFAAHGAQGTAGKVSILSSEAEWKRAVTSSTHARLTM